MRIDHASLLISETTTFSSPSGTGGGAGVSFHILRVDSIARRPLPARAKAIASLTSRCAAHVHFSIIGNLSKRLTTPDLRVRVVN